MNIMDWSLSGNWKFLQNKGIYSFVVIWKTRNIRSLFSLKDKTSHVSSVVYNGKCNCGENYICETGWNVTMKLDKHSDIDKNSEVKILF